MEKKEKHAQYYEAILQLRDLDQEMVDFVSRAIDESGEFVSKTKKYKDGIDLYLSSNKLAKKLGGQLVRKFGGELKVSERLYSRDRQTSKDKYRLSVFFRPCSFKKGDIIILNNKLIKITSISKKGFGIDLANNKRIIFDYKKKNFVILKVFNTRICKIYPVVSVLHPETFDEIGLKNPGDVKIDDEVRVVLFNCFAWRV